jgi:predicted RNase H-like HicB family nuclease
MWLALANSPGCPAGIVVARRSIMSDRTLQVVVYREGDGFVAQCLNIDVASEGDTEPEALANLREALELYFDDTAETDLYKVVADAHLEQITLKSA